MAAKDKIQQAQLSVQWVPLQHNPPTGADNDSSTERSQPAAQAGMALPGLHEAMTGTQVLGETQSPWRNGVRVAGGLCQWLARQRASGMPH